MMAEQMVVQKAAPMVLELAVLRVVMKVALMAAKKAAK